MSASEAVAVEVRALSKLFGEGGAEVAALRAIDLVVKEGEFLAVMGPSGSGKSTLLHLLGGLDTPSAGSISIDGHDLGNMNDEEMSLLRRRHIGFVFQAYNLLHLLTAEENVALPMVLDGRREAEVLPRVRDCLELVGVGHRKDHFASEMSGGEQQRVAIARAMCSGPKLLLVDEPTGNLDSASGKQIISLLRQLVDEQHQTIVMVTHNADHASRADRIVLLADGVIVEEKISVPRLASSLGSSERQSS